MRGKSPKNKEMKKDGDSTPDTHPSRAPPPSFLSLPGLEDVVEVFEVEVEVPGVEVEVSEVEIEVPGSMSMSNPLGSFIHFGQGREPAQTGWAAGPADRAAGRAHNGGRGGVWGLGGVEAPVAGCPGCWAKPFVRRELAPGPGRAEVDESTQLRSPSP